MLYWISCVFGLLPPPEIDLNSPDKLLKSVFSSGPEETCPLQEMNGVTVEAEDRGEDSQCAAEGQSQRRSRQSKCRHSCPVCSREFSRPSRLADHMNTHSGDKPYCCSVCGKCFTKKINVTSHQRVHTGEKPYSCPDCGISYAQPGCLRRHRLRHAAERPYACSVCDRGFFQRRHLVQHERTHTGERPFCCPLCPKRFASRTGLSGHQKTHAEGNVYSCSFCHKGFSTASSFRDHVRLHTGQKPHPCSLCCKSFNRPGLLRKHLQRHADGNAEGAAGKEDNIWSHDGDRPSQCDGSMLDFPSREDHHAGATPDHRSTLLDADKKPDDQLSDASLNQDEETVVHSLTDGGPGSPKKIHSCSVCGKSYLRLSKLRAHFKVHAMENLYGCSLCTKSFSNTTSLKAHEKTHEKTHMSSRPHSCSICSKSFLRPCRLRKHMAIHVRDGVIADPADEEFWLNIKEEEEEGLEEQDSEDITATQSRPLPGNHGDQDILPLKGDKEENKDGDVSGLINSDGEEEDWRTTLIGQDGGSEMEADIGGDGKRKHCCPVCGRDCFKASALQKHLRIHSGERPFQCPTCRKSFTQQVHMTEHQRIHTGEKPYTCTDCNKSFTFSSALRRHQRLHTDARPYQCPVCQKTFKQQSVLKSHQLIHSGVRYQCPFCSKSFSRAVELTYHVDMHSDTQPYFCNICKKNLSGARIFRKHMKKHEMPNSLQAGSLDTEVSEF